MICIYTYTHTHDMYLYIYTHTHTSAWAKRYLKSKRADTGPLIWHVAPPAARELGKRAGLVFHKGVAFNQRSITVPFKAYVVLQCVAVFNVYLYDQSISVLLLCRLKRMLCCCVLQCSMYIYMINQPAFHYCAV